MGALRLGSAAVEWRATELTMMKSILSVLGWMIVGLATVDAALVTIILFNDGSSEGTAWFALLLAPMGTVTLLVVYGLLAAVSKLVGR
jgi:hypothetical protein